MKKLLLTLSMLLGVNTSTVMAELTQTELHATMGIVTNFILDDSIVHNGTTYGTVTSPFTGKVWLDRNLGAHRVCTSFDDVQCYGDYYQWGRNFDGHQDSGSDTTPTLATDINNAGNSFIPSPSSPYDWAATDSNGNQRFANWSKTDGSSVCPVGFRVPTLIELKAETLDHDLTNGDTAFANFLKLPSAGGRDGDSGALNGQGSWGDVWSSSVSGSNSYIVDFVSNGGVGTYDDYRAQGHSVRCLKDTIVHNSIIHNGTTYDTVTSPFTGEVWLDRNLGASRVCTSFDDIQCFGDYYQWGRNFDGHQDNGSGITIVQSSNDENVGHGDFIIKHEDWVAAIGSEQRRVLKWSKTDGSSVCPVGFRVPTEDEFLAELFAAGAHAQNNVDIFNTFLKIPSSGDRSFSTATLANQGENGHLWANTLNGARTSIVFFGSGILAIFGELRSKGYPIRCIRD